MYEAAICDAGSQNRECLKKRLSENEKYGELIRFHEYDSGKELLDAMGKIRFSIIFLDVEMNRSNGEEIAGEIRKSDKNVVLVFCTDDAEPSPDSFEAEPYRFIKKNMTDTQQDKYINDSLEKMAYAAQIPTLTAKIKSRKLYLRPDDIVYIEKFKKSAKAHVSSQALALYEIEDDSECGIILVDKVKHIYNVLKMHGFGYPHDSYLINFKYMISCKANEFKLDGYQDSLFKIARSKAKEFNYLKKEFMVSKSE